MRCGAGAGAVRACVRCGAVVVLVHTVDGYRGMPPLGTCGLCSEQDLRELVRYMAGLP